MAVELDAARAEVRIVRPPACSRCCPAGRPASTCAAARSWPAWCSAATCARPPPCAAGCGCRATRARGATLMKFWRSSCSYWRLRELVLGLAPRAPPPRTRPATSTAAGSPRTRSSRRRTSRAAGRPACCSSIGRSRTSCTRQRAGDHQHLGKRRRSRASRIMRPTRGSSGSCASSPPIGGELVVVVHRAQLVEQLVAVGDRAARRRIDEGKVLHHAQVQRLHAQDHAGQRRAQDFRVGEARRGREVLLVVEADADAVGHAAAAAGALVGRRLADRLHQQLLHLAAEAVALHARRAGVDHVADARHGERGLGHVGRQHDAPRRRGCRTCGPAPPATAARTAAAPRHCAQRLWTGACAGGRPPRGSRARRAGRPGCRPRPRATARPPRRRCVVRSNRAALPGR